VLATRVGENLGKRGYLVRTGAGPGIMDAVPVGWKRQMSISSSSMSEEQTQGVSDVGA
jgi:predicted Rossmann-fold nucleotide-binding protein